MKKILVVGSINMDMVITVDRIPESGETLTGREFQINLGGKGANQAISCAKLGGCVKMLGCVGCDGNGTKALEELSSYGVDVSCVRKEDAPTGVAMITVCNGDNRIIIDQGANGCVTPQMIDDSKEVFEWADIVILQLEIPMETVLHAVKMAKSMGKLVVLNPAPIAPLPEEVFSNIDWIVPNETEALSLTQMNDSSCWESVLEQIKKMGVEDVIITLGEQGCIYSYQNEVKKRSAYLVKAVDTTAAGDTFVGAFCTALGRGDCVDTAIDFAAKASSVTVTRKGAGISIPYLNEIE